MTNKEAIETLKKNYPDACFEQLREAVDMAISALEKQMAIDALAHDTNVGSKGDMIYRQDAIHVVSGLDSSFVKYIEELPPAKPEPLTDREQRIFLAAMGREEKVCEEVDRNHIREAYEDSLMWVCREIKRKVKGVLWT